MKQRMMYLLSQCLLLSMMLIYAETQISDLEYIKVDLQEVRVEKLEDHWLVGFGCQTRVGQCSYEYGLLPDGWRGEKDMMIVPIQDTKKYRSYAVIVVIKDPTGEQIRKSLVVEFFDGAVNIYEKQDFYEQNNYAEKPKQPISPPPQLPSPIQQPSQVLTHSQQNTNSNFQFKDISKPLTGVPTLSQIDYIINSGDIVEITQTIQEVITAPADCQAKIDYLNSVIGKLQNYIAHNKGRVDSAELVMESAESEVARLEDEMKQMKEEMKTYEKAPMEEKMKELDRERQTAYSQYQLNEKVSQNYLTRMKNVREEDLSDDKISKDRGLSISLDQLQIQKIKDQIKQNNEKIQFLSRRIEMNKQLQEAERIAQEEKQNKMEDIQNKFKQHSQMAIKFKIKYIEADYEMNIMKSEMEQAERDSTDMKKKMETIENKIQNEKSLVDMEELSKLKKVIEVLERNLPHLQKKSDELYYECSGAPEAQVVQEQTTNNTNIVSETVFFVRPNAFSNYLYQTYGVNFINPAQQKNLYPVSVFSLEWRSIYGVPYPGFGVSIYPSTRSFECYSGRDIISGYGVIERIRNGVLLVRGNDGNRFTLNIGICTRLENTEDGVPLAGQNIFWRGKLFTFNTINLFAATFY